MISETKSGAEKLRKTLEKTRDGANCPPEPNLAPESNNHEPQTNTAPETSNITPNTAVKPNFKTGKLKPRY